MKYGFVKLVNDKGIVYIEPWQFEYYRNKDVFKNHAVSLCIFDNIYIGCFPLLVTFDEIKEYNEDVKIINEISVNDICFQKSSFDSVSKFLGCDNAR